MKSLLLSSVLLFALSATSIQAMSLSKLLSQAASSGDSSSSSTNKKGDAQRSFLHRYQDTHGKGTTFQQDMGHPGANNCTAHWFNQFYDHFTFGQPHFTNGSAMATDKFPQKFLTFDKYYKPGGPIFFYAGNEAPISAFADIAGLMWQNAEEFNAALVFAEHRFFGETQPCGANHKPDCVHYLSTMQAMADYAVLLTNLTDKKSGMYKDSKGVITFGGSYGGMLSAWMRIKYPNIITGSVASSAPIRMVSDTYDTSSYWKVITDDATAAGGSEPMCATNVHKGFEIIFDMLEQQGGPEQLTKIFKSCTPIPSAANGGKSQMGYFIQAAFDLLGMGDYPFPIGFIFGTADHPAPAWPMRTACKFLGESNMSNTTLLEQLVKAISVVYNVTEDQTCYETDANPTTGYTWNFMVCAERIINELPFFSATGPPNDMFYQQQVWNHTTYDDFCKKTFDVHPRYGWLNTTFGAGNVEGATNIVFANGLYDPWHSGGILWNVSETVRSYIIPEGAHHLDLLFTSPADPPGVAFVRAEEMRHVKKWLSDL